MSIIQKVLKAETGETITFFFLERRLTFKATVIKNIFKGHIYEVTYH